MDVVTLSIAAANAKRKYQSSSITPTKRIPCASRVLPPGAATGSNAMSNGTIREGVYRSRHVVLETVSNLQLDFPAYYNEAGSNNETPLPNDITVSAGISIGTATATQIPVSFNGRATGVVPAGSVLRTDDTGIQLRKGDVFWVTTLVSVAEGGKWPVGKFAFYAGTPAEGAVTSATPGTVSLATTIPVTSSQIRMYGPMQIVGKCVTPVPVVGIVGDSIGAGFDDDQNGMIGHIEQALINASIPHTTVAAGSDTPGRWASNPFRYRRSPLLAPCTHIICNLGTNGVGGVTTDVWKANQIIVWRFLAEQGFKTWQTTMLPRTTTSDGWATDGGQTVDPDRSAKIHEINQWLRDGAPMSASFVPAATGASGGGVIRAGAAGHPISGVFDTGILAETSLGSGKWKTTGTTTGRPTDDGVHPSTAMSATLVPGINTSVFTV